MSNFRQVRPGKYEFRLELGYDSLGKRIRKFKTLPCKNDKEAKKILARLEVDYMDGKFTDDNHIRFEELYKKWQIEFAPFKLDPNTQETYEYVIEGSILPDFRNAKVKKIKARDIIRFLNKSKQNGDGQYALEKKHRCIRSLFTYAKQFEYVTEDVSEEVPKPAIKRRQKDFYDENELSEVFEVIKSQLDYQRLMIILAITGSLRRGEVMAIDMNTDLNFDLNTIRINKSVQRTKKHGLRIKSTKNEEERIVTFDPITMKEIYDYRKKRKKEIMKIRDEYKGFKHENGQHIDLLFGHIDGSPFSPRSVTQFWNRIVKRYNLKKIAFHDLRHSAASYLLSQGFSMKVIQERLGHKDISTTMNLYTHITKELDQDAGNAFLKVRN
ncbi:tyrosine-type recombinase/integrase [Bacillus swezeyi]|uniref:tyrosine-type recombinase/integrase n=1 Tax=Bacillus swezeyi TaxID=1925020 RepID=UPI002E22883A|nr:tyrosine-type recombinase/integrase [Bacillus swezeyi]